LSRFEHPPTSISTAVPFHSTSFHFPSGQGLAGSFRFSVTAGFPGFAEGLVHHSGAVPAGSGLPLHQLMPSRCPHSDLLPVRAVAKASGLPVARTPKRRCRMGCLSWAGLVCAVFISSDQVCHSARRLGGLSRSFELFRALTPLACWSSKCPRTYGSSGSSESPGLSAAFLSCPQNWRCCPHVCPQVVHKRRHASRRVRPSAAGSPNFGPSLVLLPGKVPTIGGSGLQKQLAKPPKPVRSRTRTHARWTG
jgi:hypothetical protein